MKLKKWCLCLCTIDIVMEQEGLECVQEDRAHILNTKNCLLELLSVKDIPVYVWSRLFSFSVQYNLEGRRRSSTAAPKQTNVQTLDMRSNYTSITDFF